VSSVITVRPANILDLAGSSNLSSVHGTPRELPRTSAGTLPAAVKLIHMHQPGRAFRSGTLSVTPAISTQSAEHEHIAPALQSSAFQSGSGSRMRNLCSSSPEIDTPLACMVVPKPNLKYPSKDYSVPIHRANNFSSFLLSNYSISNHDINTTDNNSCTLDPSSSCCRPEIDGGIIRIPSQQYDKARRILSFSSTSSMLVVSMRGFLNRTELYPLRCVIALMSFTVD